MSDIAPIITAEFDVEFSILNHSVSDQEVGDIICRIRNEGPGVGYVTNVRCRIRYRLAGESGKAKEDEPDLHIDSRLKDSFTLIQKIVSFSRGSRSGIESRLRSLQIHA